MSKKQILNDNNQKTSSFNLSSSNPFTEIAKRMKQIKAKNYGKATVEALRRATKNK